MLALVGLSSLVGCPPPTRRTLSDGSVVDDGEVDVIIVDRSRSISFEPVQFAPGSTELSDDARAGLEAPAARLADSGAAQLELTHHCAARDADLCERRAEAIEAYFERRGVDSGRIQIKTNEE